MSESDEVNRYDEEVVEHYLNEREIELEEYIANVCADFPELQHLQIRLDALLWREAHPWRWFWQQYFFNQRRWHWHE